MLTLCSFLGSITAWQAFSKREASRRLSLKFLRNTKDLVALTLFRRAGRAILSRFSLGSVCESQTDTIQVTAMSRECHPFGHLAVSIDARAALLMN